MTIKVLQGIIRRKIQQWLDTITDAELREAVANNVIVTGGSITSLLLNEVVNDYDVYLKDKDVLVRLMSYYLAIFAKNPPPRFTQGGLVKMWVDTRKDWPRIYIKSAGVAGVTPDDDDDPAKLGYKYFESAPAHEAGEYVDQVTESLKSQLLDTVENLDQQPSCVEHADVRTLVEAAIEDETSPKERGCGAAAKNKYRPIFMTSNAITLSDRIQLVTRFSGTAEEIHKNFDFVHCTNWYDFKDNKLVLSTDALAATLTRELRYVGSLYPICSIIRLRKFIKRGWTVNAGQIIKMAFQVSDLDLTNLGVLEDQLIGVDAAYFVQLVDILRDKANSGQTVDTAYVIELIDQLL